MPMCTFINDCDKNIPTTNREINELLQLVRKNTEEDWQILELIFTNKKFLRKEKVEKLYNILVNVGGFADYQSINFYRENTGTSINDYVPAELVVAYMYGLLNVPKKYRLLTEEKQ